MINLIVIAALDVVSKKAIGTAAGFIGLFGYIGRTVQAKGFGWTVEHYGNLYGEKAAWDIVFLSHPRQRAHRGPAAGNDLEHAT